MLDHGVFKLVDPRKQEAILWACSVKVGQINTNSPATIRLFDQDHICYPLGVLGFSNEANFEELIHLNINDHIVLDIECSMLLLNSLELQVNVKAVDHYTLIYSWHILV